MKLRKPLLGSYCVVIYPHFGISSVHSTKRRIEKCDSYRGISLVAYAGKILLKIIARRLSEYYEHVGVLPAEQSGFQPNHSTTGTMFVIR